MTKHTPGPWTGQDKNGKFNSNHGWSLNDESASSSEAAPIWANGNVIAFAVHSSDSFSLRSHPSVTANARLIAAAPDLLEALQNLIEAAESMKGTYTFVQGETPEDDNEYGHEKWAEEFLQEMVDAARAAIAKATGEQS